MRWFGSKTEATRVHDHTVADGEKLVPVFLSTEYYPERERFDAWRDEFAKCVARVDLNTPDKANFYTDIHALALPKVTISKNTATPCSLMRTPRLIRDGDDAVVFFLCLEGQGEFVFGDNHVRLKPGNATLVPMNRIGGSSTTVDITACSLRISRDVAHSFAPSLEKTFLCESRPNDPSIIILRSYLEALLETPGGLSASMGALADNQIRELLAHIVNPASDLARSMGYGGVKTARLRAVLQYISTHVTEPQVSAATVGRRLGLSGRYVQKLLEGAGLSFSAYVRELRLDRARQMLRDPHIAHKRISDICEMAGFSDLSHFNRAFRARFGQTPKDARHLR